MVSHDTSLADTSLTDAPSADGTADAAPTFDPAVARAGLRGFADHYRYDTGYLEHLLAHSPAGFRAFTGAQPMGAYRAELPLDAHFVARVVSMREQDCGACAQLNLRMALEAGVERETLRLLLEDPDALDPLLTDVRGHAIAVARAEDGVLGPDDLARVERLRQGLGEAAFCELALTIAGSRIYPTLKRALGQARACEPLVLPG